jgi:hypothetical protein
VTVDLGVVILGSTLPLAGVALGAGATVWVQRSSVRESRDRLAEQRRTAQRAEVKSSVVGYLETAQHLQTKLNEREHGGEVTDLAVLIEQVWLAQEQIDIICPEQLRKPVEDHASALNEVTRHEADHPDWWGYVSPYTKHLLDAVRDELSKS